MEAKIIRAGTTVQLALATSTTDTWPFPSPPQGLRTGDVLTGEDTRYIPGTPLGLAGYWLRSRGCLHWIGEPVVGPDECFQAEACEAWEQYSSEVPRVDD